jgi:hypothetical protein
MTITIERSFEESNMIIATLRPLVAHRIASRIVTRPIVTEGGPREGRGVASDRDFG